MQDNGYFLSLNPQFKLEQNLPPIGYWSEKDIQLIQGAKGILLPKYFPPHRYHQVTSLNPSCFPRIGARYQFRGKCSQSKLFQRLNLPHPLTFLYDNVQHLLEDVHSKNMPLSFPCVLKGDRGGGGSAVFPVYNYSDLFSGLDALPPNEPLLLQEWIANKGMDLRVVVIGSQIKSYFRIGGNSFYNNVSKGASINRHIYPHKQTQGISLARQLNKFLALDLAAFDLMFSLSGVPLIIEINFLFGKKGLGGNNGYEHMFRQAVREWISSLS